MRIYYKDTDKNGKVIYFMDRRPSFGYHRISKSIVESQKAQGLCTIADYVPNKPYQEMTDRQLKAALKGCYSVNDTCGIEMIKEEIEKRNEQKIKDNPIYTEISRTIEVSKNFFAKLTQREIQEVYAKVINSQQS